MRCKSCVQKMDHSLMGITKNDVNVCKNFDKVG